MKMSNKKYEKCLIQVKRSIDNMLNERRTLTQAVVGAQSSLNSKIKNQKWKLDNELVKIDDFEWAYFK